MTVYNNIILIIYSNEMVHQSDGLSPLMEVLIYDTRFVAVSHGSYLFLLPELSWVLIFNGGKIARPNVDASRHPFTGFGFFGGGE